MSTLSWQTALSRTLQRLQASKQMLRIAVVGIGHELRGDDAAGPIIARMLRSLTAQHNYLLVIDAGPAPESYFGTLRRFRPHFVLLIDAAQLDDRPGTVACLAWQDAAGPIPSSHTCALSDLASYLIAEFGCEVMILGIQPAGTTFDAPLSAAVQQATEGVVQQLAQTLLIAL